MAERLNLKLRPAEPAGQEHEQLFMRTAQCFGKQFANAGIVRVCIQTVVKARNQFGDFELATNEPTRRGFFYIRKRIPCLFARKLPQCDRYEK